MYLKKCISNTNGYHKKFLIKRLLNYNFKFKKLTYRLKLTRNFSINGTYLNRSQKPISVKKRNMNILYLYKYRNLKVIIGFSIYKLKNKLLTLWCSSSGFYFYSITTFKQKLFKYSFLTRKIILKKYYLKNNWKFLFQLKRLSKISLFSLNFKFKSNLKNYIKYCRAVGSYAKITRFNKVEFFAIIQLPSKSSKIISLYNIVSKRPVLKFFKKKFINTYASSKRLMGKKSLVRGVAMNPVDHPHGGRTKSIKLQLTPWGKPTKLK